MRQSQLLPCGKAYKSAVEAGSSKRGQRAGAAVVKCLNGACGRWHVRNAAAPVGRSVPKPRRVTGFPAAVKLDVRTRAGNGDPDLARCEACPKFLGRYGGQVQHRLARGAGGSRSTVINGISNGALLCGDAFTGCHGKCEKRNEEMRVRGWWIRDGKGPDHDPRLIPVTLVDSEGLDLGERYLTGDGTYSEVRPELAGAA